MGGGIKDLFGNSDSVLSKTHLRDIANADSPIESSEYIENYLVEKERFLPTADFSTASNFAIYGSAEQYVTDAIQNIYQYYPYDGSLTEKIEWINAANYYDIYMFQFLYPRTCGYAVFSPEGWGTQADLIADAGLTAQHVFGLSNSPEYIQLKAGPHPDPDAASKTLSKQFPEPWDGSANIWDDTTGIDRVSNIVLDPAKGITTEFWFKKDGYVSSSTTTRFEYLFDVWNGHRGTAEGESYGRYSILHDGTSTGAIKIGMMSGSQLLTCDSGLTTSEVFDNKWHHIAIAFQSGSDWVELNTFFDGKHHTRKTSVDQTNVVIGKVTGSLIANIGAARIPAISQAGAAALATAKIKDGYAKLSGSIDEFRFWKTARTPKQIGRFWFTQIAGGTNTDNNKFSGSVAPVDLGFYYKFNEGNTGDNTIDSTVLDYSGRISNGIWTGFVSGASRVAGQTSSAMIESSASISEFKDPIIYSSHPDVAALSDRLTQEAKEWDVNNNSSLYYTMPEWIISEDVDENGETLKKLTQMLGVYFDTLHMQINKLPSLTEKRYPVTNLTVHDPNFLDYDLGSATNTGKTRDYTFFNKPKPTAKQAIEHSGLIASELFSDVDELKQLANRDEYRDFETKLYDIKNTIYQNIYNNLIYIYKTKGTFKSFRNLMHCFGIDEDLVAINLYASNESYRYDDARYRSKTIKKNYINFATVDAQQSTIFQSSSVTITDSLNYIPGAYDKPMTVEASFIFPLKKGEADLNYYDYNYYSSSLFGCHEADHTDSADYTWHSNDSASFQVYVVRDELRGKDAKFILSSSNGYFPTLTTPTFKNVYDNTSWQLAVRLAPSQDTVSGSVITGSSPDHWDLDFYGVSTILDQVDKKFHVSESVSTVDAQNNFAALAKRFYIGAHRTNFTGSTVLTNTDVKVGSFSVWQDRLSDEEINAHAVDPNNQGRDYPYENAYMLEGVDPNVDITYIPRIKTRVLNWQFGLITGSTSGIYGVDYYGGSAWNSSFEIVDMTSGSDEKWEVPSLYKTHYPARGDWFLPETTPVETEYLYTSNQVLPETLTGDDNIRILAADRETFVRDTIPTNMFFAIEKSMAQVISKEMLDMLGAVTAFNNLVGNPVNRYRQNYKSLEKVREMFFRKVDGELDFDRFLNFYNWVDGTLSEMLLDLVPATANVSQGIRNVIESHILERNKYWNKFPTLEMKDKPIIGYMKGIKELTYDWKHGHAPLNPTAYVNEDDHCLWWKERSEASASFTAGNQVDTDRNVLRRILTSDITTNKILATGEYTDPINYPNSGIPNSAEIVHAQSGSNSTNRQEYKGSTYAIRRFAKPYKLDLEKSKEIRSGHNPAKNNKGIDVFWAQARRGGPTYVLMDFDSTLAGFDGPEPNCDDAKIPVPLRKVRRHAAWEGAAGKQPITDIEPIKARIVAPFVYLSQSSDITTARAPLTFFNNSTDTAYAGLHVDTYGPSQETPMQSPFTEKNVGGRQYRHAPLSTGEDGATNRTEGFRIYKYGEFVFTPLRDDSGTSFQPGLIPRGWYYRDEVAKRPVNIRNIQTVTSSNDLGNYSNILQLVNTQDTNTSPWFVKLQAATGSQGLSVLMSAEASDFGISDIPDRPKLKYFAKHLMGEENLSAPFTEEEVTASLSKHKIIERFSAPGGPDTAGDAYGGFGLTQITTMYSPNNSINYRNLSVRTPLNALSKAAMGNYGSFSGSALSSTYETTALSASYHKVNRNARLRTELVGDSTFSSSLHGFDRAIVHCTSSYDNWFVQHAIPASDFAYAWITGSTNRTDYCTSLGTSSFITSSEFGSYIWLGGGTGKGHRFWGVDQDLLYSNAQGWLPTDFVGMNANIYEPVSSSTNTVGYPSFTFSNIQSTHMVLQTNYPNQVFITGEGATSEHGEETDNSAYFPGVVSMLNGILIHRNGAYGYPSWKQIRTGDHPIVRSHKKNNILSIGDKPKTVTFEVHLIGGLVPQITSSTELRASRFTNYTEPPVTSKYYPMVHRIDTAKSKGGSKQFQPLTLIHTYANNLGTFANVEIEKKLNVEKTDEQMYDTLLYKYTIGSAQAIKPIEFFKSLLYKETIYPKEVNTYLSGSRARNAFSETVTEISTTSRAWGRTFWRSTPENRAREEGAVNSMGFRIFNSSNFAANASHASNPLSGSWFLPSGSLSLWPLDTGDVSHAPGAIPTTHAVQHIGRPTGDQWGGSHVGELYMDPIGTIYGSLSTSDLNGLQTGNHFLTKDTSGLYSFGGTRLFETHGTASVCFNHFCLAGTTHDYALQGSNINRRSNEPNHIMQWHTDQFAGREPWYDSYEEFSEDIRQMGKDYTIIPEFRISEHMDHYLDNGFFTEPNFKFLSLVGATNSASADQYDKDYIEPFWKEYCHSDFLKHFGKIQGDHKDLAPVTTLSFTCNAVKKLLPYNGFYPVQRSLQLASLFSSSYGPYIIGSEKAHFGGTVDRSKYSAEQMQSLLQPFFAPGIMYNTLKSCVAVDYPVWTGSAAVIEDMHGNYASQSTLRIYDSGSRRSIVSDPNYRMPFEAIIEPHNYIPQSSSITPTDPAYDETAENQGKLYLTAPYYGSASFYCQWTGQYKDNYSLAAHNFFAEIPNFFLENKVFTTFESAQEAQFGMMRSGSTYYMDVYIHKTNDYVAYENFAYDTKTNDDVAITTRGWGYGPPLDPGLGVTAADPAFAPFTPPYFYGRSVARIQFTPHLHAYLDEGHQAQFSLEEILQGARAETQYYHEQSIGASPNEKTISNVLATVAASAATNVPATRNRMHVSSSVSLFGKRMNLAYEFDPVRGDPISATENPQAGLESWVINTKFECPSLNFYGAQGGAPDSDGTIPTVPASPSEPDTASGSLQHRVRGLYNGYGTVTENSTGIFLGLRDSFPEITNAAINPELQNTGSLLKVLGFKPEERKLGQLASSKIIAEAVVAIPFIDVGGERKFFGLGNSPAQSRSIFQEAYLKRRDRLDPLGEGSSIKHLAKRISRYNIPPHFDFLQDETIEPFVMYIFEFTHKLSRQDLRNIWQNVMPDIAVTAEKASDTISHMTGENEFFQGNPIPNDTRWMVFKVKQRAGSNYNSLTADDLDNPPNKVVEQPYSYNWPYDYFSLVELVKIDAALRIGEPAVPIRVPSPDKAEYKPGSDIPDLGLENNLQTEQNLTNLGTLAGGQQQALGGAPQKNILGAGVINTLYGGVKAVSPGLLVEKAALINDSSWAGGFAGGPLVGGGLLKNAAEATPQKSKGTPGTGKKGKGSGFGKFGGLD